MQKQASPIENVKAMPEIDLKEFLDQLHEYLSDNKLLHLCKVDLLPRNVHNKVLALAADIVMELNYNKPTAKQKKP